MRKVVSKFGGSSVRNIEAMRRCASIVASDSATKVVVVSATKGTTNKLESIAKFAIEGQLQAALNVIKEIRDYHLDLAAEIFLPMSKSREINQIICEAISVAEHFAKKNKVYPKLMDELYSIGERVSSILFGHLLSTQYLDRPVVVWDARRLIQTDSNFNNAIPQISQTREKVQRELKYILQANSLVVTQGFIGSNELGETTTLGREGSDYSAALIAEAIEADLLNIWTDVAGIATSDPRVIHNTKFLNELSYEEASTMASKGASVLHPRTLLPVVRKNIPVFVGSTLDPKAGGTLIVEDVREASLVRALTQKKDQVRLVLKNSFCFSNIEFTRHVFNTLSDFNIPADWTTFSESMASMVIEKKYLTNECIGHLKTLGNLEVENGFHMISLVGSNIQNNPSVLTTLYNILFEENIEVRSGGEGQNFLSFLIDEARSLKVLQRLHDELVGSVSASLESLFSSRVKEVVVR